MFKKLNFGGPDWFPVAVLLVAVFAWAVPKVQQMYYDSKRSEIPRVVRMLRHAQSVYYDENGHFATNNDIRGNNRGFIKEWTGCDVGTLHWNYTMWPDTAQFYQIRVERNLDNNPYETDSTGIVCIIEDEFWLATANTGPVMYYDDIADTTNTNAMSVLYPTSL